MSATQCFPLNRNRGPIWRSILLIWRDKELNVNRAKGFHSSKCLSAVSFVVEKMNWMYRSAGPALNESTSLDGFVLAVNVR